ncbi:serine hydrolase domain-containing protein [Mucilaginibacter flavidus]|uniref:serine hydrolase domain-containing protein n=1 Tax=Mucilaginibacter flavidus TaxID=2949309 RepID=UPI002093BA68|nr:serine hydrolase domain-containing protein [Mucilaginibacter flavidus]MCO5949132.1 beta-lactamase family protein [Mucilaginibacter flavidus]
MNKKVLAIAFLTFTINVTVYAQNVNKAKLDSFFNVLGANNKQMGSIAISAGGKLVYQNAIGYSAVSGDNKTPATIKTKYRIGSVTKMFTGTMIFQLIEEKKLTLETPLSTWFPQIPNASKITIGEMLSHRSGLHNFTDDPQYKTYMAKPQTEAAMLAIIQNSKPDFEPDLKASYSNTNFVLLGYIIEKITGHPYADELKKRIISKIGLADTYYGGKTNSADNEAYSFVYNGNWQQQPETDMSVPGGAGAIVSTPTDLVKFIEALFGGKLVSQSNLDKMQTMRENYGMAMLTIPFNDKTSYGHGGSIDSFLSMVSYFPEDKMAVAYISNGAVYAPNDVMIGVLSIYFNEPFVIPSFKTANLKTEDLDKYLGEYSSTQLPLKITVTKNNTTLMAQATGQSQFPLETVDTDKFVFTQAGITMIFNPAKGEFTLLQGGQNYLFMKTK